MAKIMTTAIVADIRNKLNGSVFSKNRYGGYVRTKVTPVNPQSDAQQAARNVLATNAQAWRGLTEAERQGWIGATPSFPFNDIFGFSKTLSGSALFVKLNNNLAAVGATLLTAAPAPVSIPSLELGAFTAAAGTPAMSLVLASGAVPAGFSLVIQATPQVGPGKSFVKNLFRSIAAKAAATTTPIDLLADYNAIHGALVEGQKVSVRCWLVSTDTGQAGIPVQATAIVAA